MSSPRYAAIVGVDGSGKSTCFRSALESLAKAGTVIGIGDTVLLGKGGTVTEFDRLPLTRVKKSLRNAAKAADNPVLYKTTKLMELICWVKIHRQIMQDYGPQVMLGDGAPLINTIAWGIRYHPQFFERKHCLEAILYLSGRKRIPLSQISFYLRNIPEVLLINKLRLAAFPVPDVSFFLRVAPDVALKRIAARGERLQPHETRDFLDRLQNAYRLICDIVDCDLSKEVHEISVDDLSVSEVVDIIVMHTGSPIGRRRG